LEKESISVAIRGGRHPWWVTAIILVVVPFAWCDVRCGWCQGSSYRIIPTRPRTPQVPRIIVLRSPQSLFVLLPLVSYVRGGTKNKS